MNNEDGEQAELLIVLRQMAEDFGGVCGVAKSAKLHPRGKGDSGDRSQARDAYPTDNPATLLSQRSTLLDSGLDRETVMKMTGLSQQELAQICH